MHRNDPGVRARSRSPPRSGSARGTAGMPGLFRDRRSKPPPKARNGLRHDPAPRSAGDEHPTDRKRT
ncbi:MAG TPA: hypothetical protein DCW71_05905 [Alistipes sp.]|nr:hypothetical protein BN3659_02068 [Alistipes sp. CHKCI003]HAW64755.1 hypothetical protein [Alistipes sp.]